MSISINDISGVELNSPKQPYPYTQKHRHTIQQRLPDQLVLRLPMNKRDGRFERHDEVEVLSDTAAGVGGGEFQESGPQLSS